MKVQPLLVAGLLACAAAPVFADIDASVVIHVDRPGAKIERAIYGQFAEHLGHGIYDGVWVGENSSIPNTRGDVRLVQRACKTRFWNQPSS